MADIRSVTFRRHQRLLGEGTSRRSGIDRCNNGLGPTKSPYIFKIVINQKGSGTVKKPEKKI
jgi:hypothetical protein